MLKITDLHTINLYRFLLVESLLNVAAFEYHLYLRKLPQSLLSEAKSTLILAIYLFFSVQSSSFCLRWLRPDKLLPECWIPTIFATLAAASISPAGVCGDLQAWQLPRQALINTCSGLSCKKKLVLVGWMAAWCWLLECGGLLMEKRDTHRHIPPRVCSNFYPLAHCSPQFHLIFSRQHCRQLVRGGQRLHCSCKQTGYKQ